MSARLESITIRVEADDTPDTSYLDQPEFADRLAEYRRDEFHFVGVRLVAEIAIPDGEGWIRQDIVTPGVWGIESDSGEDYFRDVAEDEAETLREMLKELHVSGEVSMKAQPLQEF